MTSKAPYEHRQRGSVIWVCSNGCIDVLHKTEGNALDLCSVCKDGVCEPRATIGKRSKEQRQRDRELGEVFPAFAASLKKPRRPTKRSPAEIKVTRPGLGAEIVPPDAFAVTPPDPPFQLTPRMRQGILDRNLAPPRIAFPKTPPEDHPDGAPYPPAARGDVVEVSKAVRIVVVGVKKNEADYELLYEVHDRRGDRFDRIRAWKPLDPDLAPTTFVEQFRGEPEPQQVPARVTDELAKGVHRAELRTLTQRRGLLADQLTAMASEGTGPKDARFYLKKTVEELDRRINYLKHELASTEKP